MTRTFVIAEAGSCHDGSFDKALRLVDAAAAAGADACKFQHSSSAKRLTERRHAEAYLSIYERYAVSLDWVVALERHCRAMAIEFMCSTYLPEDVAAIAPFVRRFKVASFEANATDHLLAHAPFLGRGGKELLVSCGLGGDPYHVIHTLWDAGWNHDRLRFLHCVSAYPTPASQLNLDVLRTHEHDFSNDGPGGGDRDGSHFCGLSDHSTHPWTGALAVAAGATIIEAHLKLDDTDPENPDAPHSRAPAAFAEYVSNIRFAEACLGDGKSRVMPAEAAMLPYRVRED